MANKLNNDQLALCKKYKVNQQIYRFCEEYIIDFNGSRAATAAKYSKKSAHVQATRLLKIVKVQKLITELCLKAALRNEITIDRVLKEMSNIAFFDPALFYDEVGNLLEVPDMPETARRVIAGITVTSTYNKDETRVYTTKNIKLVSKDRMIELAGRYLAMFTDKIKVSKDELVEI